MVQYDGIGSDLPLGHPIAWTVAYLVRLERALYQEFGELTMWFLLLLAGIILLNLLRLLPYTRAVWQRVRADWTQLLFLIYGGIVFFVVILFEEYHYEEPWKFAAWVYLALGGWLYLRLKTNIQRILALIGGVTLAMWTAAIGKWIIVPFQDWPVPTRRAAFSNPVGRSSAGLPSSL